MLKTLVAHNSREVRAWKRAVLSTERSSFHLSRKVYHALMGLFCTSLYAWFLNREQALLCLFCFGGLFLVLDLVRLKLPQLNSLTLKFFGRVMRREELKSVSGNSYYILGLLVLVMFFPKPIALLSGLFLALGDPIAAVVGSAFGKIKITRKKTLEGALANWGVCGAISFLFGLSFLGFDTTRSFFFGLLGGTISMGVELLPSPIDDNFTIPVGSALLLSALAHFFQYSF